jgi:hypothetical protein
MKTPIAIIILSLITLVGCSQNNSEIKEYISSDLEECKRILFTCDQGKAPFFDEAGCGCELNK